MNAAIVHDYVTQRGGAERVVLSMLRAFPGAPLYTSLYEPKGTFPEYSRVEIHTSWINRFAPLRRNHRLALPLLGPAFSRLRISADVVVCSSSGWAHGVRAEGRKVVYCHSPARWLYQTRRYLGTGTRVGGTALGLMKPYLLRWDRRAAASANLYLAVSTAVRDRIQAAYGIEAEVLPPPCTVDPGGPQRAVEGLEAGFFLCVSRLLPYKNVDVVAEAFRELTGQRLVVVGTGPESARLRASAPSNVTFLGTVSEEELRWLYGACVATVAASYEDYGLTPIEGATFGRPAAALQWGGFLDTLIEGETGVFFPRPEPRDIAIAARRLLSIEFRADALRSHAARYSEDRFIARLRAVAQDQLTATR